MSIYYNKKTITIYTMVAAVIGLLIGAAIIIWVPITLWVRIPGVIIGLAFCASVGFALGAIEGDMKKPKGAE